MNIKRNLLLLSSLILLVLTSCEKKRDYLKESQIKNEEAFLSYAENSEFEKVSLPGLDGDTYIYMKWLKDNNGVAKHQGEHPRQTDLVKIHYQAFVLTQKKNNKDAQAFDSNMNKTVVHWAPILRVQKDNNQPLGLAIALQNMAVGDKVEVIIPWYLSLPMISKKFSELTVAKYYLVELNAIDK